MENSIQSPAQPDNSLWGLPSGHVHVWIWQVGSTPLSPGELATLDTRERNRAARFRPQLHRARWVRCHTGMRQILAGYLNCSPAEVAFRRGPNGKPRLHAPNPPTFNLSHSEDWCALAVAHSMEIGIDIQTPHQVNPALWRRVLTPIEHAQMLQIAPYEQDAAFFRCWTRKEAVGKADSQGVYIHLKRTETGLLPHASTPSAPSIIMAANASGIPQPWHLTDLTLPAGLFGALATAEPVIPDLRNPEQAGLTFP
ncbi:MAG: 4'-phosphopantetheinyl transferase superfamily protein [Acidobacteria bacterium]|nr:4'-phosphopantetheinyl transferase superfamily protein [Acidobacteriota bacterium]